MEETVKRHGDRLYRTALVMLGGKADAEDMVQDAFVKLIETRPRFQSPEHEAAWLIRVTVNLCKNRLRSHGWRKTVPLWDTYPARDEEEHTVVDMVSSLPPKYRTVIHLHHFEGYSVKEIAVLTGQTEAAVRKQHTRAKQLLKDCMKGVFA